MRRSPRNPHRFNHFTAQIASHPLFAHPVRPCHIAAAQIRFIPHEINFNEPDILDAAGGSLDFTLRAAFRKITLSS